MQSFAPALKLHYACPAAAPDPGAARAFESYYSAALAAAGSIGLATSDAHAGGDDRGRGSEVPHRAHFHTGRLTVALLFVLLLLAVRRMLVTRARNLKAARLRSVPPLRLTIPRQ